MVFQISISIFGVLNLDLPDIVFCCGGLFEMGGIDIIRILRIIL